MGDGQERTEQATPKRRERARAQGQHPASALVPGVLSLALAALPLACVGRFAAWWVAAFDGAARNAALAAHGGGRAGPLDGLLALYAPAPWAVIGAAFAGSALAAVSSAAVTGSLGWSPRALRWRLAPFAPGSIVQRIASAETSAQTILALCAIAAVAAVAAPLVADVVAHPAVSWRAATAATAGDLARLWCRSTIALAVVAALDVALARRRFASGLKMTPREVRDERAEQEGRPEIRSRRRGIALRRSRRLRIEALKRASAVVANPTHVAVALRYAPPAIDIPVVVAAGAGAAAAIVRALAAYHDVPVIESPEVARALFVRVDVDEPIPEEMFAAIAAIFAWILRTRGRLGGADDP